MEEIFKDLTIIGKTDLNSQIQFIESLNKAYTTPLYISIINSLKELKSLKEYHSLNLK